MRRGTATAKAALAQDEDTEHERGTTPPMGLVEEGFYFFFWVSKI